MTSGDRDIEAQILRQGVGTDDYGQPSAAWESLATIWVSEDVNARNSRVSDRNQPSFAAEFTALEIDCRHVKTSDMLRVYYADYQIDAIVRVPGSRGMISLACSVTESSQTVPGVTGVDGSTSALTDNHI